ncbi:Undecaprenyl phosphate-alpha-4-amino-4-deoxy-L-arabinose arabinosyl transferase [Tepidimonas charontis]|uniref:Undecaprenyl phosphate-alpha-4-amino-4-deoxy-L-arabinose arabinosyl transferase n=1 Tax=Tepidimonas charontis TaxID=2267262 RepID=A0A554XJP4_9BURK|nr:Undecaprenyl phosphate-alpha-4-amino-4-deoxy-L-arabinose arabinosyl transferase [Tepidimonas charontis]
MRGQPAGWAPLAWAVWVVALVAAVAGRPLLPIDETRYAAVAWEMWRDQHWLYPTLDGAFYAHKPPLLFWLTLLGWHVWGVADWVPRALVALMGGAAMVGTVRLAARLWPDTPAAGHWVPMAFGLLWIWPLYAPAWYFDVPNALWCVMGVHGVLDVAARRWRRATLLLLAASLGGVFTKGPMVWLTVGAVAVCAPLWGPRWTGWRRPSWMGAAVLLGSLMAAGALAYGAWLWAASIAAGEPVWRAVLGAQALDRVSTDADHAAPWWWYLGQLPWMLWPGWLLVLALWRKGMRLGADAGTLLVVGAFVVLGVVLSLVAGKRPHYWMGWLPLAAAWLAWWLARAQGPCAVTPVWRWLAALPPLLLALAFGAWATRPYPQTVYGWTGPALWAVVALPILWSVWLLWPAVTTAQWVRRLATGGGVVMLALHLTFPTATNGAWQVRPLAERVGQAMRAGTPVAWAAGAHHGVLTFYGRLPRTPQIIDPSEVDAWVQRHPNGWVLVRSEHPQAGCTPYRGRWLCLRTGV